jgi:hypothetical protein
MSKHPTFFAVKKHLQVTFSPQEYITLIWSVPPYSGVYTIKSDPVVKQYWEKLPEYLVSRCPFCHADYRSRLDTHSLKYWRFDPGNASSVFTYDYQTIGCRHFVAVHSFLNLNGHFYTAANQLEMPSFYSDNGDIPFISPNLLPASLPSIAVMHSLPICDLEENQFKPRYSLYMITYYGESRKAVLEHYHKNTYAGPDDYIPLVELPEYMRRHPKSAALKQWVAQGKLQWLDPYSADLSLCADPPEAFPYSGITGYGRRFVYHPQPVTAPWWDFWRKQRLVEGRRIELR